MSASEISGASQPAPRAKPNAWRALAGIWRLTLRRYFAPVHWLALGGTAALLGLVCFGYLSGAKNPQLYLKWVISFYVTFLVPTMAFLSAGGAIRDELKSTTTDYVFTRPVRRPLFLIGRYLAHLVCAQVDFLCVLAVVVGAGIYREVPGLLAAVPLLLLAQVLLVVAFSALGFLGGVLTARYPIVGLIYGGVIEVGVGQIPTQISQLSMTHQINTMLLALTSPAAEASVLATTGLLLLFSVTLLGLAAVLFTQREFTGQQPA